MVLLTSTRAASLGVITGHTINMASPHAVTTLGRRELSIHHWLARVNPHPPLLLALAVKAVQSVLASQLPTTPTTRRTKMAHDLIALIITISPLFSLYSILSSKDMINKTHNHIYSGVSWRVLILFYLQLLFLSFFFTFDFHFL